MAPPEVWNLVIASVGGQGAILANAVIGRAAAGAGLDVATAETHGMAQRYGRVTIHLRIGREVHGPLITAGDADALLGLEPLETLRSIEYCSQKTTVLLNRQILRPPSTSITWHARYPNFETVEEQLREASARVITIDGEELARAAGSDVVTNAVMLGALSAAAPLPSPLQPELLRATLLETVPKAAREVNGRAFDMGQSWVQLADAQS